MAPNFIKKVVIPMQKKQNTYVFEFETFEVELPDDEENPNISDYMYSINVTSYRVAEDDELGLEGKMPTVEIVSK